MPWYLDQLGSKGSVDIGWKDRESVPAELGAPEFVSDSDSSPLVMVLRRARASLPDYFTGPTHSLLIVSDAFRVIVESFEPNKHHFISLHIETQDGSIFSDKYFIFKNGGFVDDGIVVEESEVGPGLIKGEIYAYLPRTRMPRLMWRRSKIEGRHIWADRLLKRANIVSDDLYAEIKSRKMKDFLAIESQVNDSL